MTARRRIMLDTNVWSMLGRAREGLSFYELAGELRHEVVLAPSVLLELSRSSNVTASQRDVQAMLSGPRVQLPTEAELICQDLLVGLARLHPDWLHQRPDLARARQLNRYWTVHLWRDARKDWPAFVEIGRAITDDDAQIVYESQKAVQGALRGPGVAAQPVFVSCPRTGPRWLIDMWPEEPGLEAWRYEGWSHFSKVVEELRGPRLQEGTTRSFADWLEGAVDIATLSRDPRGWATFWFHELDPTQMPHFWLAVTAQRYQVDSRIERSSPFDAQHASYLVECDVFLTADRRYVGTLETMARDAPFHFARPVRLSGREGTVIAEVRGALG